MDHTGRIIRFDNQEIIGLVPAAGEASRLNPIPCSKELIPIGIGNIHDAPDRPKVVSQYLLEKYKRAGVTKVFFILRKGKWDIPAYFGDGAMMDMDFAYLLMKLPFGVPFTLDQAYAFIQNAKVMIGFPDILFGPTDAFAHADQTLIKKDADLVVGLYPVKDQRQSMKCDMVQWDNRTLRIERVLVKPKRTELRYSWIFAIWTPVFTGFMHSYLKKKEHDYKAGTAIKEIYLGDVVQHAIDEGLNVIGHAFEDNSFIDIGTPDELIEAYKEYQNYEGL
jgi:glucose-1-phosphate thymidylyltransferase